VLSVGTAGIVMLMALTLVNGLLITSQQTQLRTILGGGVIAVPVIMAPGMCCAPPGNGTCAPTAAGVKVIVFGAGEAGAMLISRLLSEPNATYRPVAILDDDLGKRRCASGAFRCSVTGPGWRRWQP